MAHLMLEESVEKLDWGLKEELSVWFIHMAGKLVLAGGLWHQTLYMVLLLQGCFKGFIMAPGPIITTTQETKDEACEVFDDMA